MSRIGKQPVDVPDKQMGDRKVAAWATEQLQKKHDKPFFIACGFFRPHLPWYVPKKYFDMYPPDKITLPNVNDNDVTEPEPEQPEPSQRPRFCAFGMLQSLCGMLLCLSAMVVGRRRRWL